MSRSAIHIIRPLNVALTFGAVLLGGWLAQTSLDSAILTAAFSASLIAASGYIHNDILDLAVDRIIHPGRPLPAGRISTQTARRSCILGYAVGLGSTATLTPECQIAAVSIVLLLLLYNGWLKRLPLIGNLVVGLIGGAPFLFGGLATPNPLPAALPAAFAAIFHLAREILKDIQDRQGDRAERARTLPTLAGAAVSKRIVTILLCVVIVAVPIPAFTGRMGPAFLSLGLVLDAMLLLTICLVWQARSDAALETPSRLLKAGMFLGILAFWLDTL